MITADEQDQAVTPNTTALSGVPEEQTTMTMTEKEKSDNVISPVENKEESDKLSVQNEDVHKGARPKTQGGEGSKVETKKGSRGAFRSQLYGLKKRAPKDRSYRCRLCGVTKRSTESLNAHHRKRHEKLNCTVCGKVFDLDTSLQHHMYSHFSRKYYCDRCDYHCHFQSELDSHKIMHRENPSYQCMYPKCGKWFKCKGELTLHVEVHRKIWYDCSKCDFSTLLVKYLKEHEKSHSDELPYPCTICGERFRWRSGLKRHKEKKHSG